MFTFFALQLPIICNVLVVVIWVVVVGWMRGIQYAICHSIIKMKEYVLLCSIYQLLRAFIMLS